MDEYISRRELLARYDAEHEGTPGRARELIKQAPAADVAPVRHGRWEFPIFADSDDELDPRLKCSECGSVEAAFARWNYCPACGARMDKEAVHET